MAVAKSVKISEPYAAIVSVPLFFHHGSDSIRSVPRFVLNISMVYPLQYSRYGSYGPS